MSEGEKPHNPEGTTQSKRALPTADFPSEPFPCPACGQMLGPSCRVCVACKQPLNPAEIKRPEQRAMLIGERIRQLREQKGFSQDEIERATGLLRCYISRVEEGHTAPSLEILERLAAALDVPLDNLFYTREGSPVNGVPDKPHFFEKVQRWLAKMATALFRR